MDKSKLIWGIVCLVIAGALAVANMRLPPENLMFQVGDANVPWVPPIILGLVGIVLLVMAGIGGAGERAPAAGEAAAAGAEAADAEAKAEPVVDPEKAALNKRLETIAWGLFLIMLGGAMFVPRTVISKGIWSIGVGAIMLGLNAARYFNGIKMSGFTTFLGVISVIGGILQFFTLEKLEGAILIIVLGAYLIAKPWFEKQKLFGKAEEG